MSKRKRIQVKPRLKVHLLMGKRVTHNQAQVWWKTNRLASYVWRLQKEFKEIGKYIHCQMVYLKNGQQYGVYSLKRIKK